MMKTSGTGIALIKDFEKLRLTAYDDGYGFMTIGWGHRIGPNESYSTITRKVADQLLEADTSAASGIVNRAVKVPLNQNQFDALVSFAFNVGPGRHGYKDGFVELRNGHQSSILRLINDGNMAAAAQQFGNWVRANGEVSNGLIRRRSAEKALFMRSI